MAHQTLLASYRRRVTVVRNGLLDSGVGSEAGEENDASDRNRDKNNCHNQGELEECLFDSPSGSKNRRLVLTAWL